MIVSAYICHFKFSHCCSAATVAELKVADKTSQYQISASPEHSNNNILFSIKIQCSIRALKINLLSLASQPSKLLQMYQKSVQNQEPGVSGRGPNR